MLVLKNSKKYIIVMYIDGEKLKSQASSKPHNCFLCCFCTSRLTLSLEDLSANLNVCVRYGWLRIQPKSPKHMQLKCINTIAIVTELTIAISIVINYRYISILSLSLPKGSHDILKCQFWKCELGWFCLDSHKLYCYKFHNYLSFGGLLSVVY